MDVADQIDRLMAREALPGSYRATIDQAVRPLAARIVAEHGRAERAIVVGLCGSQGSGKSTFAVFLTVLLEAAGLSTAILSVDDLYLTAAERQDLARTRHPLLGTRGPPGTHDMALGLSTLEALTTPAAPHPVRLPRFDKATDTRLDPADWPKVRGPVDVVVFEGWFVGARPQPPEALEPPVNELERELDQAGIWRRYANAMLGADYQAMFARIDLLVLLQAPGFEHVHAWRALQEEKLAARLKAENREGSVMDEAALARFIMHYERLTRWILREMPARANVVVRLGPEHQVLEVRGL